MSLGRPPVESASDLSYLALHREQVRSIGLQGGVHPGEQRLLEAGAGLPVSLSGTCPCTLNVVCDSPGEGSDISSKGRSAPLRR